MTENWNTNNKTSPTHFKPLIFSAIDIPNLRNFADINKSKTTTMDKNKKTIPVDEICSKSRDIIPSEDPLSAHIIHQSKKNEAIKASTL